jgi:hypothetical protein
MADSSTDQVSATTEAMKKETPEEGSHERRDSRIDSRISSSLILQELEELMKRSKSFNIHMNILKRLLNLKEPEEGYAFADTNSTIKGVKLDAPSSKETTSSSEMDRIHEKIIQFGKQVQESESLTFCLAFNVQRLQKLLTGLALDANAADDVVQDLWKKFNASKTNECILKYEFEEKRKLLKRLRKELEQARREWKNLKIRISKDPVDYTVNFTSRNSSSSDENDWSEGNVANNSDSAVHSDEGDESSSSMMSIFESRSQRLDHLEKECFDFVNQMITREPEVDRTPVTPEEDSITDSDRQLFQSPIDAIPVELLVQVMETSDEEEDFESEEDGVESPVIDSDDLGSEEEEGRSQDMSSSLLTTTASSSISQLTLLTPDVRAEGTTSLDRRSRASSQSSPTDDEEDDDERRRLREESLAETGEPLLLCRLRRRAVEVLVSRLREEKAFHESREKELDHKLKESIKLNQQLRSKILGLLHQTEFNPNDFVLDSLSDTSDTSGSSSSSSDISPNNTNSNNRKIFFLGVGFTLLVLNLFYGLRYIS